MNDIYEPIEWVNYWVENNQAAQRMLVIGDSVARQFRKMLKKQLKDKYAIDLIATSCYPGLNQCLKIIEDFFVCDLEYEYIIVNLGAHHGYNYSTYNNKEEEKRFTQSIVKIFQFLENRCSQLLVLSGTPESAHYNKNNLEIQKRNGILQNICDKKSQYLYIDLYEQMEKENFEYIDAWCHFREDGDCFIVQAILSVIMGEMPRINIITTVKEFQEKLDHVKKIYVFGNGKRGKSLKEYFENKGITLCGVVVSPAYINKDENLITLDMVEDDAAIIVTPMEIDIMRQLTDQKYIHFFLTDKVYEYIYMFNEIFEEIRNAENGKVFVSIANS